MDMKDPRTVVLMAGRNRCCFGDGQASHFRQKQVITRKDSGTVRHHFLPQGIAKKPSIANLTLVPISKMGAFTYTVISMPGADPSPGRGAAGKFRVFRRGDRICRMPAF
jgi:hypothetical protein